MWWDSLTSLQQTMFVIATTSTVLMILMIVMMLIGMDGAESFDGDINVDFDGGFDGHIDSDFSDAAHGVDAYNSDSILSISGLKIISIRGALAFLSIGGWMTYALAGEMNEYVAGLIGVISGMVAAVLLAIVMKAIYKLESSGNLDYRTAIGKTAVVYIRIPKKNSGKGKVMFNHQGRLIEVDAVTRDNEDILTKNEVKIIDLLDETTLVVGKIKEEK